MSDTGPQPASAPTRLQAMGTREKERLIANPTRQSIPFQTHLSITSCHLFALQPFPACSRHTIPRPRLQDQTQPSNPHPVSFHCDTRGDSYRRHRHTIWSAEVGSEFRRSQFRLKADALVLALCQLVNSSQNVSIGKRRSSSHQCYRVLPIRLRT